MRYMKPLRIVIILFLIIGSIVSIAIAINNNFDVYKAASKDPAYRYKSLWAPGCIVVDFKDSTPMDEIKKLEKDLNVDLKFISPFSKNDRFMRGYVGEWRLKDIIKKLNKNSKVECAEPDYYLHAYAAKPNDPLYKYQWNLEKINTRSAWDITQGNGVIVAVIDTGVAYRNQGRFHRVEDLEKTGFVKGYNFVGKNDKPFDDNAHGTHVAGTIAQTTNNGKGVAGIAPKVKIMPLKVLSANGFGRVSDIADAIRYAADHKAKVINMSLGGPFPSLSMKLACRYAYGKGVVIVCAAGNSRGKSPGYPAAFKECIAVSATRFDDKLAPYTNRGPKIDIAAPGGDTTVDQNEDGKPDGIMQNTIAMRNPEKEGYYIFQGTSMASPHVAAVAAMIASTGVTDNREIVHILKKTARKKDLPLETGYGAGILDAKAAVSYASGGFGWTKFILAFIVLLILLVLLGTGTFAYVKKSVVFYIGWLLGACGLFFIPMLLKGKSFPGMGILSHSVTEWDIYILGAGSHANPIFFSALIPFIVAVLLYKTKLQKLATGFSLGVGINMLYHLLFTKVDVQWIPGTFLLDKLWMIGNIIAIVILLLVLLKNDNKPKGVEET